MSRTTTSMDHDGNETLSELISRLRSPDPASRVQAALGLSDFDSPKSIAALRVALHDSEAPVRHAAAESLAEVSPGEAGRWIAEAMVKFVHPDLAGTLLRLTLDYTVVPPLRLALKRADQEWKRLVEISGQETQETGPNPVTPILQALGRISDPLAARDLFGILEEFGPYRRNLVEILTGLGEGIKPLLEEKINQATGPFRQALLEVQTRLGLPLNPRLAVEALENENEAVRKAATASLIEAGDEASRMALLRAFEIEFYHLQSAKAHNDFSFYALELRVVERADALGRLGDARARPLLEGAMAYPSPRLRGFLEIVIESLKPSPGVG